MEAILLSPALKSLIWGGTKLQRLFGKENGGGNIAESWELSAHKDGQSVVASGPDTGLTLSDYVAKHGKAILGTRAQAFPYFPLLIKFIDAADDLSVQVHPEDSYALAHEGEYGKTEMWYILEAEPGAALYCGFEHPITREEFQRRIQENTLLETLHRAPVKKGDVFFIEAGTVHAIGKGIVICEIQQNSNTTYRVYDYDRRDAQGNPRQLHIPQAVAVAKLGPAQTQRGAGVLEQRDGYTRRILASCQYFTVERLEVETGAALAATPESFQSLLVTQGAGALTMEGETLPFRKGDSIFLPAGDAAYTLTGPCEVILSYI